MIMTFLALHNDDIFTHFIRSIIMNYKSRKTCISNIKICLYREYLEILIQFLSYLNILSSSFCVILDIVDIL